jgi:hypothetical protein
LINTKKRIRPYGVTNGRRPITLQGLMPVVPEGMEFMPNRDYTYCRICGVIFQPELNRVPSEDYTQEVVLAAELLRREWSQAHAKTHPESEHRSLALSGRHCTPEALQRLVPFGIIPVSDLALDAESEQAGLEAGRMPINDVEGVRY